MEFQIDVKKPTEGFTSSHVNIYINGECFNFLASKNTIDQLKDSGLVKPTMRSVNDKNGKLVTVPYENGCDGMGVMLTSYNYTLIKKS